MTEHTTPFRHWIIEDWCKPVSYACLPDWDDTTWEARYDNDLENGKRTTRNVFSHFASVISKMRSDVEWWRRITGIADLEDDPEMWGGGLHVMLPGGWLSTHLDYDRHIKLPGRRRAMNLIAFLNPEWKRSWGGALVLCDPNGDVKAEIFPEPGKLVAFETNDVSYHGVQKVSANCPVPRMTAAVYYLSVAGPNNTRTRAMFLPNRSAKA